MKKRALIIGTVFTVVLTILFGFQNCGQVEFTQTTTQKSGDGGVAGNDIPQPGDTSSPGGPSTNPPGTGFEVPPTGGEPPVGEIPPVGEPPVVDVPPVNPPPGGEIPPGSEPPGEIPPVVEIPPVIPPPNPTCPEGQVYIDGACQVQETTFTDCQSFVELNTNVIPDLKTNGICYYKKLISAMPVAPSGSRGEIRAEDVLSRRHGGSGSANVAPYVLGDSDTALGARLNLTFLGKRKISFTSDRVGSVAEIANKSLRIDNYILVELFHNSVFQHAMARGTADALLSPNNAPIQLNGQPVTDFRSYASGGTANVGVISYSDEVAPELLPVMTPIQFRVRMLDCGSSAQSSDMFIIIH